MAAVSDLFGFLRQVRKSNLLSDEQWADLQNAVADQKLRTPSAATEWLTSQGLITAWQSKMLLMGKRAFFLGKYRLEELIGAGAMGAVFRARQPGLDRSVAVKLLSPKVTSNEEFVQRFLYEMQAVGALSSPHIVAALDAESADNLHFLVMEYVEGIDLGRRVAQTGPMPLDLACECIRQAALGLQDAADAGLVHRDIKPSNLILSTDRESGGPIVRILDFGLARFRAVAAEISKTDESAIDRSSDAPPAFPQSTTSQPNGAVVSRISNASLSHFGQLLGTPDYMSPEQARDTRAADTRSDLYSLGCTFFRILTGESPFPRASINDQFARINGLPVELLRSKRNDLPAEVIEILRQMLEFNPDQRVQSPRELARRLAPFSSQSIQISVSNESKLNRLPAISSEFDDTLMEHFVNQFKTSAETSNQSALDRRRRGQRRRRIGIMKIIAGILASWAVLILVVRYHQPVLSITWPETNYPKGSVSVAGVKTRLPEVPDPIDQTVHVRLHAGTVAIHLERDGYEPIDSRVTLRWFMSSRFVPDWIPTEDTKRTIAAIELSDRFIEASPRDWRSQRQLLQQAEQFLKLNRGTVQTAIIARAISSLESPWDAMPVVSPDRRVQLPRLPTSIDVVQVLGGFDIGCWNRVAAIVSTTAGDVTAIVSTDRTVQIVDRNGTKIRSWELTEVPTDASFIEGTPWLVITFVDHQIGYFDATNGSMGGWLESVRPPFCLTADPPSLFAVGTSVEGRDQVSVFSLPDGQPLNSWDAGRELTIQAIAKSPHGPHFALESLVDGVVLYDVRKSDAIAQFPSGVAPRFSPDGRMLAIGTAAGDTQLISTELGALQEATPSKVLQNGGHPWRFVDDGDHLLTRRVSKTESTGGSSRSLFDVDVWDVRTQTRLRTIAGVAADATLDVTGTQLVFPINNETLRQINWSTGDERETRVSGVAQDQGHGDTSHVPQDRAFENRSKDHEFGAFDRVAILPNSRSVLATGQRQWLRQLTIDNVGDDQALRVSTRSQGGLPGEQFVEITPEYLSPKGDAVFVRRSGELTRISLSQELDPVTTFGSIASSFDHVQVCSSQVVATWRVANQRLSQMRFWNLENVVEITQPTKLPTEPTAIALSFDERRIALATSEGELLIWHWLTKELQTISLGNRLPAMMRSMAFLADDQQIVVACENRTQWLIDISSGTVTRLKGDLISVQRFDVSLNGRILAGVASDRVVLYDVAKKRLVRTIALPNSGVNDACFDRASQRLAIATNAGHVEIHAVKDTPGTERNQPLTIPLGPMGGRIWQVRFADDGRHLVTLNGNSTVSVIRLPRAERE